MDPENETEISVGFAPNAFKHGTWKTWQCYGDNILLSEEEYENGMLVSQRCWDKQGSPIDCK
jgi:hypothetical protein